MNRTGLVSARGVPVARALGALLLALTLLGCGSEREVTLLVFSDFHGALVHGGVDPATRRTWGGARALVARIEEQRRARPERTFLFDAGDTMQGTPESNFFYGRTTIALWNRVGVDAAALGNHEFDWGIDTLRARSHEMRYPLLAANVFELDGTRPEWVRPATLLERDGVRVGVVGFVTPDTPRLTLPHNVATLRFEPPERHVQALVDSLREHNADLVVLVCHLGATQEADSIRGPLARLARAVRGVDAILGGHSHTVVAGSVDAVPIVVPGSRGRRLGRVRLHWDGRRVVRAEAVTLPAYADSLTWSSDNAIAAFVDSVRAVVRPLVERVVTRTQRALDVEVLANVVTDAMRDALAADVAVTNVGGLRTEFRAGEITEGDLFELIPFENTLVTARLSGSQLRAFLGSQPGEARVAGIRYTYDPMASGAQRTLVTTADGGEIAAARDHLVVTNNFLAHGGDGFHGFLDGRDVFWSTLEVREAVRDWMRSNTGADGFLAVDREPRTRIER